jgi:diaminopimelate decarboxylase
MSIVVGGQHSPLPYFDAIDDELLVAGEKLSAVADRIGRTPFYAYDRSVIARKVAELRAALPAEIRIHYAIKANPMPEVVELLRNHVDGLDVASCGELEIALAAHANPNHISFAGPGKRTTELEDAVRAGITINVESERELAALTAIANETGKHPRIAIRINPNFELKLSGMKMGGGAKPFGIDAERVPDMLKSLHDLPLDFYGFHIFSGSQSLHADAIASAQTQAFELAESLAVHAPVAPREINLGGGFGIPYFPGDRPLDLAPIGANLTSLVARARKSLPHCELVLELGRYLVGECGVYVCKVVDRKISRGQTFLIVDGGLHHHLSASGNFGQVLRKNYPVLVGNRVRGEVRETVTVAGPLCTPLDVLADKMEMARAEIGDLIVVMQSGAYGLTASPVAFLHHPAPHETLL